MLEDIPAFLRLTAEQRAAAWHTWLAHRARPREPPAIAPAAATQDWKKLSEDLL